MERRYLACGVTAVDLTANEVLWAEVYVGFPGFYDLGSVDDVPAIVHLQHAGFGGFGGNGRDQHALRNFAGRSVRIRKEFDVDSRSISTASLDEGFRCGLMKFGWASCARTWPTMPIWRLFAFCEMPVNCRLWAICREFSPCWTRRARKSGR